jgi:hypothetical protein
MATMTITITVNAKGVKWSRTATIADIDATALIVNENVTATASSNSLSSYPSIAVGCVVNNGQGTLAKVSAVNGTAVLTFVANGALPVIFYNGAGTGYTGGVSSGASNTGSPNTDIESIGIGQYVGTPMCSSLFGYKPTS